MVKYQGRYYIVSSTVRNVWSAQMPWDAGSVDISLKVPTGSTAQIGWAR
jgi:hypothetical protein